MNRRELLKRTGLLGLFGALSGVGVLAGDLLLLPGLPGRESSGWPI
jgi:hypothetical protein